jgi:predicted permease
MSWWSRLGNMVRTSRVDRELDEELQFHVEARIDELEAQGLTREEARTQVARRFGQPLRWREQSRDVKLVPWLESIRRDVHMGLRMLRKNAVVSAAAVVSLSLPLGACVAAFAVVDALILRPLPVREPRQLVYLTVTTDEPDQRESETFSDPLFLRLRDGARDRVDLLAISTQVIRPAIFGEGGEKEPVRTQFISGDVFDRLGIRAMKGRVITTQDDAVPGASPVAVVSHAFWTRRFGGDPNAIGRWFGLEGRQFQIVGIADQDFAGVEPGHPTDVWMPYAMYNPRAFGNAQFNWFRVMGRLHAGVRIEQAQSVLQAALTGFRRDNAGRFRTSPAGNGAARTGPVVHVRPAANGPSPIRREFQRSLWILTSIAALVLLIAGANVANLFLARTVAREREMALRLSIGAGRHRLIQQMLVESALLAAMACALGLLFASIAAPTVVTMLAPADDPVQLDLRLNWRLMAVAGALTLLTTALFGLAPALRASGVAPLTALKGGGRSAARTGVMRPFVAMQVAFGLIVLFVGGLLVLSFARLSHVSPGFATSDVLLISLDTPQRVEPNLRREALFQALERLRSVPRVTAVSAAEFNALGRAWTYNAPMPGQPSESIESTMSPVTNGYFESMSIPVLAGRSFAAHDMEPGATAIIVNEAFATQYFGDRPAVGGRLDARFGENDAVGRHDVVGVVANTRYDLREPAAPTIYMPLRTDGTIVVRVAGDAATLASSLGPRLREEVRSASPVFRATTITPQSVVVGQTLLRERLLALLAGFFAVVGLVLAAVGLYGVLSYSVAQRTREIGIRVALGARQSGVIRTVLTDVGGATLVGAIAGLGGGLYLSRFVQTLLFEVTPLDFWSLTLPVGLLLTATALASTLPALRAARVDPVTALRYE